MTIDCPHCPVALEIPEEVLSGGRLRCPGCTNTFDYRPQGKKTPVRAVRVDDPPPAAPALAKAGKKKKKSKKKSKNASREVAKPFWKTRNGLILNGIGLVALGLAGIALFLFIDSSKRMTGLIAGVICILIGIAGIGKAATQDEDGESSENDDDNSGGDDSGGDDDF